MILTNFVTISSSNCKAIKYFFDLAVLKQYTNGMGESLDVNHEGDVSASGYSAVV